MIRDLSETLQAMLDDPALPEPLQSAQISFDTPTDVFKPTQPTVDLFLYDIRENDELRSNEPIIERQNGRAIIHRPPFRIACSYLVTAWPTTGTDLVLQEHKLLSQVLQVLLGNPTIPRAYLRGELIGQLPPLPVITSQPDGLKNSDFWFALGIRPRPALTLTATISLPAFADVTGPLVTTRFTGFDVGTGVIEETIVQIGGRVLDTNGHVVAGALVDITDIGIRATTDTEGRYSFLRVPPGTHTIRAVAVGFQPKTQALTVPGRPQDYEVILTPL